MKITIFKSAEEDLEAGWHFYEDQETGVGDYYFETVMKAIRNLRTEHGLHLSKGHFHRAFVQKFHCGIYYTVESEHISIRRVLDHRRDPQWIRSELKRTF